MSLKQILISFFLFHVQLHCKYRILHFLVLMKIMSGDSLGVIGDEGMNLFPELTYKLEGFLC